MLADAHGHVMAAVPRVRVRVDSGVSIAGRTVRDPELERFGRHVARATGLTYVANVQCRRDRGGRPALLEVNPRIPGTLGLTIASGVDMPRLALDALLGRPVPAYVDFREVAVVRFLDQRFVELADISTHRDGPPENPGMSSRIALDEDFHVHSTFSDGASTLAENVQVARERELRTLCLVDHVRRDTAWVPDFVAAVSAVSLTSSAAAGSWPASRPRSSTHSGQLDVPPGLDGAGRRHRSGADRRSQVPRRPWPRSPGRGAGGDRVRRHVTAAGGDRAAVEATANSLRSGLRSPLLAHLFSLLPKIGLTRTGVRSAPDAPGQAGGPRGRA